MSILDWFDDYIAGPFNLIDRAEGILHGILYNDRGHRISVLYHDSGGNHTRQNVEAILRRYGIATYGRTHDSKQMHFLVKKRQARWAEYILLHASVKITSPLLDERNGEYVSLHEPGWMPQPWSNSKDEDVDSEQAGSDSADPACNMSMSQRVARWLED